MKIFLGLITPLVVYSVITLLHIIIPAKRTKGYVRNEITGEVMNYRINGKYVLPTGILIWVLLGYTNIVSYTWLYENRWLSLIGAFAIG
ncbi:MAG: ergosterol biosynthesis protein, partial [Clostridia bacterium]|nr:ergosterol biosynthesis protein [Clostridia bacterium]